MNYLHGVSNGTKGGRGPDEMRYFSGQTMPFSSWQSFVAFRKSNSVNKQILNGLALAVDKLYQQEVPVLFSFVNKTDILRIFNFILVILCLITALGKLAEANQNVLFAQASALLLVLSVCCGKMIMYAILNGKTPLENFGLVILLLVIEVVWLALLIVDVVLQVDSLFEQESRQYHETESGVLAPPVKLDLDEAKDELNEEAPPPVAPVLGVIHSSSSGDKSMFRRISLNAFRSLRRNKKILSTKSEPVSIFKRRASAAANVSLEKSTGPSTSVQDSVSIKVGPRQEDDRGSAQRKESQKSQQGSRTEKEPTEISNLDINSEDMAEIELPQQTGSASVFKENVE